MKKRASWGKNRSNTVMNMKMTREDGSPRSDKGFLGKVGPLKVWFDSGWRKRFCALKKNTLFLHKNDKSYWSKKPPVGLIRLTHDTPVSIASVGEPLVDFSGGTEFPILKKNHAIKIVEDAHTEEDVAAIHYFVCPSSSEQQEWLSAMRHNIDLDRKPRSDSHARKKLPRRGSDGQMMAASEGSSSPGGMRGSRQSPVPMSRLSASVVPHPIFKIPTQAKTKEEREAFDNSVRKMLHSFAQDSTTHLFQVSAESPGPQRFPWEIDWSEVEVVAKIGEGGFGEVLKGIWRNTEIAIKQLVNEEVPENELQLFLKEIALMSQLRHPNILLFMGASIQYPNIFYMTEFVAKGNLKKVLETEAPPWPTKVNMALDAARGMNYLHLINPPVLHRDLKSLNLLVDENYRIRVADFGLCKLKDLTQNTKMGTINWVAPEILRESGPYTEKADVFSFGLVLWEILTEKIPYHGLAVLQIVRAIDIGKRPEIPEGTDPAYVKLVEDCWADCPEDRPDFDIIYKSLMEISLGLQGHEVYDGLPASASPEPYGGSDG